MKKIFFLVLAVLLLFNFVSANTYGSNTYGCGLFGIGCSNASTGGETGDTRGSSGGGGGSATTQIQFDVKILEIDSNLTLGDYFNFNYFVKGVGGINHDVTIDFWIEDPSGTIISSGSDVIYFGTNEEKTESASLLIPEGIESGIYQLKIKASYNSISGESHRTIQLDVEEGAVKQLFDISMFLEETEIKSSDELTAVIDFENFGEVATEINLTYSIIDSEGRKVYLEEGNVTIEAEKILRKNFDGLNLPEGMYTLILETLYGENVYDKFEQDFEIKKFSFADFYQKFKVDILGIFGVLILIFIGIILIKRHKKKKSKKKKTKNLGAYQKRVKSKLKKINK